MKLKGSAECKIFKFIKNFGKDNKFVVIIKYIYGNYLLMKRRITILQKLRRGNAKKSNLSNNGNINIIRM